MRESIEPVVYLPYLQTEPGPPPEISFIVRTLDQPAAAIGAIRQTVQAIDGNIPLFDIRTQDQVIARSFTRERLFATLSSFFGVLALALVCVGLYGVMSYTVARRTREIGVRAALGARSLDLLLMILRETLLLVGAGAMIGIAASLAMTRLVENQLYGVTATDPLTISIAVLLLLVVSTLAGYLPARRATKVDPLVALRYE